MNNTQFIIMLAVVILAVALSSLIGWNCSKPDQSIELRRDSVLQNVFEQAIKRGDNYRDSANYHKHIADSLKQFGGIQIKYVYQKRKGELAAYSKDQKDSLYNIELEKQRRELKHEDNIDVDIHY